MKPRTWILLITLILLIAIAFVGYFGLRVIQSNKISGRIILPPEVNIFYIDIRDYGFMPENFSIKKGDEIIWKNLGTQNHSVVFPLLNVSSGILTQGANFSVMFNFSGNFSYGCSLHPEKRGNIEVC